MTQDLFRAGALGTACYSITGAGNNRERPAVGASGSKFHRTSRPAYTDGVSALPRAEINARNLSNQFQAAGCTDIPNSKCASDVRPTLNASHLRWRRINVMRCWCADALGVWTIRSARYAVVLPLAAAHLLTTHKICLSPNQLFIPSRQVWGECERIEACHLFSTDVRCFVCRFEVCDGLYS